MGIASTATWQAAPPATGATQVEAALRNAPPPPPETVAATGAWERLRNCTIRNGEGTGAAVPIPAPEPSQANGGPKPEAVPERASVGWLRAAARRVAA